MFLCSSRHLSIKLKMTTSRRGPERAKFSQIKVPCAFAKCQAQRCCKNVGQDLQLKREETDLSVCRKVRSHSHLVRFCCKTHLSRCRLRPLSRQGPQQRGREPMDLPQIRYLCEVLLQEERAWAMVLLLLQLFLGERRAAALQAQFSWFHDCEPGSQGAPRVMIPRVNKKTVAREVPLPISFANLLYNWMHNAPLKSGNSGDQWPFPSQPCHGKNFLFAGLNRAGDRDWTRPLCARTYANEFTRIAGIIAKERAKAIAKNQVHVFDSFNLDRLGSHSIKKSAVCLLKDQHCSTSLITALTGTSGSTLEKTYDHATPKRVRDAVTKSLLAAMPSSHLLEPAPKRVGSCAPRFCCHCATPIQAQSWKFCPECGHAYVHLVQK